MPSSPNGPCRTGKTTSAPSSPPRAAAPAPRRRRSIRRRARSSRRAPRARPRPRPRGPTRRSSATRRARTSGRRRGSRPSWRGVAVGAGRAAFVGTTAMVTVPPVERVVPGLGRLADHAADQRRIGRRALGRLDLVAGVLERLGGLVDGRVAGGDVRARSGAGWPRRVCTVPPGGSVAPLPGSCEITVPVGLRALLLGRLRPSGPASSIICVAPSAVLPTTPGTRTPSWPLETVSVTVRPLVACCPARARRRSRCPRARCPRTPR